MTLAAGTKIGAYEIDSLLGAGGMGEVYRANDARIGRAVALKVLPEKFFEDEDSRARFEREARTLASLNHPGIATLYSFEEVPGSSSSATRHVLVMELIEGETLASRLVKGPLAVAQVISTGGQIADALEGAHRQGIVHRDLKPGNVMLTKSGVKLLDFGLAKTLAPQAQPSGLTSMPTMAPPQHLTQQGTILGTFQYMAPEQLEGGEADARSDIFSFGAVLYEMATGKKAFDGKSQASLIGAILKDSPPPISSIAPMAPPALDRLIATCLSKDPEDRLQTAHDVKLQLQWVGEGGSQAGLPAPVAARRKHREKLAWALAAAAAAAALVFAIGFARRAPRVSSPIFAAIPLPEKTFVESIALSPDGRTLAFTAGKAGAQPGLWIRTLGSPAARQVAGAEEASFPFWSPDSRFIGYFTQGSLKKIDPSGGPPLTVCEAARGIGGAWSREGTIVFAPEPTSPLFRVPAAGGKPEPVTRLDASLHVTAHRYPVFLPDGRHFLYMAANLSGNTGDPANSIRVGSLDGKTDKAVVAGVASNPSFVAGFLLYPSEGALLAVKIDPARLEVQGDAVPVAQRLNGSNWYGYVQFTASDDLLLSTPAFANPSQLAWFDRNGRPAGTIGEPGLWVGPRLSPDGRRIAVGMLDLGRDTSDIWLFAAAGGAGTKFVFGNGSNVSPVWAPTADRLLFGTDRKSKGARSDLWTKSLDGSAEEVFLESPDSRWPEDWSPDGRSLSLNSAPAQGKRNNQLWIAETAGERKVRPFATEANYQEGSRFSPGGRWLAFASDESGRFEVYVRPFPGPGGRWQISTAGGSQPHWRRDGKELAFLTPENKLMAVPISTTSGFHAGPPALLFAIHPSLHGAAYDATGDHQRFLVNTVPDEQGSPPLSLLVHWTRLLEKHEESRR
jgi:Tol biopolymer transport system component/tRNA A-37 threonylcarbamoyl transferase component Bud32